MRPGAPDRAQRTASLPRPGEQIDGSMTSLSAAHSVVRQLDGTTGAPVAWDRVLEFNVGVGMIAVWR